MMAVRPINTHTKMKTNLLFNIFQMDEMCEGCLPHVPCYLLKSQLHNMMKKYRHLEVKMALRGRTLNLK